MSATLIYTKTRSRVAFFPHQHRACKQNGGVRGLWTEALSEEENTVFPSRNKRDDDAFACSIVRTILERHSSSSGTTPVPLFRIVITPWKWTCCTFTVQSLSNPSWAAELADVYHVCSRYVVFVCSGAGTMTRIIASGGQRGVMWLFYFLGGGRGQRGGIVAAGPSVVLVNLWCCSAADRSWWCRSASALLLPPTVDGQTLALVQWDCYIICFGHNSICTHIYWLTFLWRLAVLHILKEF